MRENEGSWGAHPRLVETEQCADRSHLDVAPQRPSGPRAGARGVRCLGPLAPGMRQALRTSICAACQTDPWTQAPATPPAAPSPATTPLRPSFCASSLALISGLLTSSPRPLATRTPGHLDLLSARSASSPHAIQAQGQTCPPQPTPSLSPPTEHLPHPRSFGAPMDDPHHYTLTVFRSLSESIARKRNFVSAQVVLQRLLWKRSARQIRSCRPFADPLLWILALSLGPLGPFPGLCCAAVACSPGPCCSRGARPRLPATVLRALSRPMSRSQQLRQQAVQLPLMASLEDVVTQGLQSLLELPAGLVAPISADERALPASLSRPRSRWHSSLPIGLAAPSCSVSAVPLGWPSRAEPRLRLSAPPPLTAALAPPPLLLTLSCLRAQPTRLALPPRPRLLPRLLTPVRLPPGWQVRGAAVAGRRSRDKCCDRCGTEDEHNTAFLLLIAPGVDERTVALGCRFSPDVFTSARQDRALADLHPVPHGPGHALRR